MLAEPRRKSKWTLNPRGTLWANDDNRLGQRMLEKLGWERGSGLGANRQGKVDPISVRSNNETNGLGYSRKSDHEWIGHQDGFAQALKSLQKQHAVVDVEEEEGNEKEKSNNKSLENESKRSRKRIHYAKFTRGKDLSLYRPEDLESILGTKAVAKKSKDDQDDGCTIVATKNDHSIDNMKKKESNKDNNKSNGGLITIERGSLLDYFAKKTKALNNRAKGSSDNGKDKLEEKTKDESEKRSDKISDEDVVDLTQGDPNPLPEVIMKKKKKKKKENSRDTSIIQEVSEKHHYDLRDHSSHSEQVQSKKSKKNAKKSEKVIHDDSDVQVIETDERHHYELRDHNTSSTLSKVTNNGVVNKKKVKKAAKHKRGEDEVILIEGNETSEEKEKKTKKRKNKNSNSVALNSSGVQNHYDLRDHSSQDINGMESSSKETKDAKKLSKKERKTLKRKTKEDDDGDGVVLIDEIPRKVKKKSKTSKTGCETEESTNRSVGVVEVLHHDLRNRDVQYTDSSGKEAKKKSKANGNSVALESEEKSVKGDHPEQGEKKSGKKKMKKGRKKTRQSDGQ